MLIAGMEEIDPIRVNVKYITYSCQLSQVDLGLV